MSARRNISQRTAPPQQNNVKAAAGQRIVADSNQDAAADIKKMHPMAVLSMHEDRLNEIDEKVRQLQSSSASVSSQPRKSSSNDESAMIAECIKQIKFLTQENQTNRNLARELTLELLRLKTSLQEDAHISEETHEKYEAFKEKAQSQSVRDELLAEEEDNGSSTVSFSGNGAYDPNAL
jgi:hypothetical protein